ncbi:MAG TPA: exodeoxyribonuclease VII small subunit [Methanotrichaceae archaeon]|nr:exodeoxyribonuclease VII small subunit [Methanotrichaceae archaeon]
MARDEIDLEAALDDLEGIVTKLEDGGISLEESLVLFERGMKLVSLCQGKLDSAEQRIESLTGKLPEDLAVQSLGDKA